MLSRLKKLFGLVENKGDLLSHNSVCEENSLTTVSASDSSSEQNVEIEDKSSPLVQTSLEPIDEGHAAQCSCPNCVEILSRFSECNICMEPLQCRGPCVCPSCGSVWCTKCSRRMYQCAWCRLLFLKPVTRCLALQRLINDLMLPCRNYSRGCTGLLTATTRQKHEEDCKFGDMMCPLTENCCTIPFEELSVHILSTHGITAIYSQEIKLLLKNSYIPDIKEPVSRRTKYRYILLLDESAFVIKLSICSYHFRVDVMRRRLRHTTDLKSESNRSGYCALIEFHTQSTVVKRIKFIENNTYGRKGSAQWTYIPMELEKEDTIEICVNITKSDTEYS